MKCYVHPNVDAVGICRACYRGLCHDCAKEFRRSLACRDRCEDRVGILLDAEDANMKSVGNVQTPFDDTCQVVASSTKCSPPGRRETRKTKWKLISAIAVGSLALIMLAVWIIIRDKDGHEVGRIKIPEGARLTIPDGPTVETKDSKCQPVTLRVHDECWSIQPEALGECRKERNQWQLLAKMWKSSTAG